MPVCKVYWKLLKNNKTGKKLDINDYIENIFRIKKYIYKNDRFSYDLNFNIIDNKSDIILSKKPGHEKYMHYLNFIDSNSEIELYVDIFLYQ